MRISDEAIAADLVPRGGAGLIISMEPLESLRYGAWLTPTGLLVTAADPFINITNYPELAGVIASVRQFPNHRIIEAAALAKEAGLARAVNMVMVGAASPFLPLKTQTLEDTIARTFASKDAAVLAANAKAFQLGRQAAA
jgi:indolepyruvate ferredoxin oxidoreductase beta subunit